MDDCMVVDYTSVGCNRTPHALDWGYNGFVCFAASYSVAIYDPKYSHDHGKVLCMAWKHTGRVSCVRWVHGHPPQAETEFLSGSTDKLVVLWSYQAGHATCISTFTEVGSCINSVDGMYWQLDELHTVVVASGGNHVCVWVRKGKDQFRLLQDFNTGSVMVLDVKISFLPGSNVPFIASAGDDGNIYLFNFHLADGELGCVRSTMKLSGHDDWIRSLSFTVEDGGDVLLASAAQDALIRVWRISTLKENFDQKTSVPDEKMQLHSSKGILSVFFQGELLFYFQLETVLQGHENWVYGLHWQHPIPQQGRWTNPLQLLSCSMDKTMIIWGFDEANGVWLDRVRVGEVGGNTLGLYGCRFGPTGKSILAHGYQGALHLWHEHQGEWKPGVVCSGHFDSVEDMIWDPKGEFAITVSCDQTTRLHAKWIDPSRPSPLELEATWHEIGRPQVHGYDMSCIASLGRFRFASGAEEKVIRVFQAPRNFLENLARISKIQDLKLMALENAHGAAVPALGLSNKPVFEAEEKRWNEKEKTKLESDLYAENYFIPTHLEAPPTEETLLQNTLWPEVQKLYGHGYELFSMAANPEGKILVSASRAQLPDHAAILVWNLEDNSLVGKLYSHTLTVTQLAFSPDGEKLLSVSRDRTWAVHQRDEESNLMLKMVAKGSGGSRVLWSCDWSPDSRYFATGSRDKRVIIWEADLTKSTTSYRIAGQPLECNDSVTAVAFCPTVVASPGVYALALGLDNGKIYVQSWNSNNMEWNLITSLDQSQAHHLTVKRLKFCPVPVSQSIRTVLLASCGADNTFKIFKVNFPE